MPFIFIIITGRHPTPGGRLSPGGRGRRMRRTRRARVLLKDMPLAPAGSARSPYRKWLHLPVTPVLPGGAGSPGSRAAAAFRRSAPPRPRLPSVSFSGSAFLFLPLPSASFHIPRLSLPLRGELMVERECGPAGGALAAARRSARPTSGSLCPEGSGLFMARPRRARQEGGGGGAALPR